MTFSGSVYPHHWVSHGVACRVAVSITRSAPIRLRQQHDHHSSHDDAASGCRTTSSILALHRLIFCAPRQADHVVGSNMQTVELIAATDVAGRRAAARLDYERRRSRAHHRARSGRERDISLAQQRGRGEAGPREKKTSKHQCVACPHVKNCPGHGPKWSSGEC